ncbi:MAG: TusE/DsrC/DsvC family sulfur relay protein [Candidatus Thioglobus sp.]|nr:TusE/DsrC/DsvC family sulfur relay protein [Candidatus Thioglobus sp.]
MALERTGNGYLVDPSVWSEEIMLAMAAEDDKELTESMVKQILAAREYFADNSAVPPIRTFAKYVGIDKKILFQEWLTGPMKPITKYGGLPQPTGCVMAWRRQQRLWALIWLMILKN